MSYLSMEILQPVTGDDYIYPGHPLTVAFVAVQVFKNLEEAQALSPRTNNPALLGSNDVPGGGDNVYAALKLLRRLCDGTFKSVDDGFAWADNYWTHCVGPKTNNHRHAYEPGIEEAEKVKPLLRPLLERWIERSRKPPSTSENSPADSNVPLA